LQALPKTARAPGSGAIEIWLRLVPFVFIVIWASGYVVARFGLPYAPPLTFLCLRYLGVIVFMGSLALIGQAPWPRTRSELLHLCVAGIMMQAGYLGGVWCAIEIGMPAGVAALIVNTQPILTAVLSGLAGERVEARQWLGLGLGFLGVALVVSEKMAGAGGLSLTATALCVFSLLSMTLGTLYQKRYAAAADVRTAQVVQFAASLLVTMPFLFAFETPHVQLTPQFILAYLWSVLALSGAGISLLFIMIRNGRATEVTSYFYLVPPVTALMAYLMFGERFGAFSFVGLVLTCLAVALVVTRRSKVFARALP
jgi:drug/metabolite transporter (DMT)-like permease